jgi:hypothetical protein
MYLGLCQCKSNTILLSFAVMFLTQTLAQVGLREIDQQAFRIRLVVKKATWLC